ncbi:iron dependent repressor, metal binding and dimerization domain protein [Gordonia sp. CPCC 205515]|uniref:metal-dependent transcriptional regulator n=1 Tax=Gordonia sp. CPCC 205515 TaxID=3140791 RepID=UPI003AF40202
MTALPIPVQPLAQVVKEKPKPVNRLIDTSATYLRTIYNVAEDGLITRRARISERLGLAGPTVSQTVIRLQRDGFLVDSSIERHLELTPEGHAIATAVTRKHRLAERMLCDLLGVPALRVHAEASKWEHVMSDDAERGLLGLLDHPTESPWGNPIPGLGELGVDYRPRPPATRLIDIGRPPRPVVATVRSISEDAQADDDLMRRLVDSGIIPGARIRIEYRDTTYTLRGLNAIDIPAKKGHIIRVDHE